MASDWGVRFALRSDEVYGTSGSINISSPPGRGTCQNNLAKNEECLRDLLKIRRLITRGAPNKLSLASHGRRSAVGFHLEWCDGATCYPVSRLALTGFFLDLGRNVSFNPRIHDRVFQSGMSFSITRWYVLGPVARQCQSK